jgi:hypothetical protein
MLSIDEFMLFINVSSWIKSIGNQITCNLKQKSQFFVSNKILSQHWYDMANWNLDYTPM